MQKYFGISNHSNSCVPIFADATYSAKQQTIFPSCKKIVSKLEMTITHKHIHLSYYRIPTPANVEDKQPAICELPDDLLLQIFNYLGSLQDVATLNVTCKHWHWIALNHRDDLPLFATFQLFKSLPKKIEVLKLMPIQPFAERFTIIIKKNTSEIGEKTLTAHKVTRFEDSSAFEDFINDGQLICTFSEIKNASQVTQESAAIELAYIDDLILSDYEQDAITRISKKVGKETEVKSGQEQRERELKISAHLIAKFYDREHGLNNRPRSLQLRLFALFCIEAKKPFILFE